MESVAAAHDFILGLFTITGAFALCVLMVMAGIWIQDVRKIINSEDE